jgi:hypothetical protein
MLECTLEMIRNPCRAESHHNDQESVPCRILLFISRLFTMPTRPQTPNPKSQIYQTPQAVEALGSGERHPLGNLICGALQPFGVKLQPPIKFKLERRGDTLGGVMRDLDSSAGIVLFKE